MPIRFLFPALAALALPAGLFGQAASPDTISNSEILRQFGERRDIVLDETVGHAVIPKIDARYTVAADFYRGVNLDWANAELAKAYSTKPGDPVDVFWMFPLVNIMEAGRGVMTPANQAHVRELWRTCFPSRLDTENHWLLYYTSLCLAAETNPDAGPDAWYNGKSSAENIAEARSYIEDWMKITTSYGQGEFNSPHYLEEYTAALALLAGWEQDPQFRREARMMLDYIYYDYAVEQLNGEFGGAHSRVYPSEVVEPGRSPAAALGWLLFGLGEKQPSTIASILAMSGYTPPPILYRIAHDRRRPYVNRELKRTRWRVRYGGPKAVEIEGKAAVPVHITTYMDPDFVIGSSQGGLLQPIQQESWSLIWRENKTLGRENTFFGLQPYSSYFEATMFFAWATPRDKAIHFIADGGGVAKSDYNSPDKLEGGSPYEQIFQHGPALIALYDMPPGSRFPLIDTFFSRDLTRRDEDKSGWIFCQGGPIYFGYRPFAPGEWKPVGWTGLLKDNREGLYSIGFLNNGIGSQCLVSNALKNGYIVQVAPARDTKSFDSFKAAVRALPLNISLEPAPEATFTTLDGTTMHVRYGGIPQENGVPVDYPDWPLFDNPYGDSVRGSGKLEIKYGSERYKLDFNNVSVEDVIEPETP